MWIKFQYTDVQECYEGLNSDKGLLIKVLAPKYGAINLSVLLNMPLPFQEKDDLPTKSKCEVRNNSYEIYVCAQAWNFVCIIILPLVGYQ